MKKTVYISVGNPYADPVANKVMTDLPNGNGEVAAAKFLRKNAFEKLSDHEKMTQKAENMAAYRATHKFA